MYKPATVVYHSADYDGIFCREIAKHFLMQQDYDLELIGWNHGEKPVVIEDGRPVYVMDLPPNCLVDTTKLKQIIWIDHHKTSIEQFGKTFWGYRIDGVAACRLAWQWFTFKQENRSLPELRHFVDREVDEPLAVRLAGEYDVWDKRDPRAETFQYLARVYEYRGNKGMEGYSLGELLDFSAEDLNEELIHGPGLGAQHYAKKVDDDICFHKTWIMQWEGLDFLTVNTARFNSLLFEALDQPDTGHDALMGFCYDGKKWVVSLYHAKHRTDLDLSVIAKKHGGGGHRGACGFTCRSLPFNLA